MFSGSVDNPRDRLDRRLVVRSQHGSLRGSSCCEQLTVAFPTADRFSLRHRGYEIATGSVQTSRSGYTLVPDDASRGVLAWWIENEVEFFWNGPLFDLSLVLRLTTLTNGAMKIKMDRRGASSLTLALKFAGDVVSVGRGRRLTPGHARGALRIRSTFASSITLDELEEYDPARPYPPIAACEDDEFDGEARRPGMVRPLAWPRPDYCR